MALKHGSTTITILKHGSTTINTGKHGSTTVFTAGTGPSWHTVMSDSFFTEDNVEQQEVCAIPAGATNVRVTLTWWIYDFATEESTEQNEETTELQPGSSTNISNSASGLGYSIYEFDVQNNILYVSSNITYGEYGLYYIEITKVEAYY